MNDKKIEKIPEQKISNIVEFGKDGNILIVETVGSFRNLMNFLNKPRNKTRYITKKYIDVSGKEAEKTITEVQAIYYPFEDSPEFELIKSQAVKLILEEKEVDLTSNNLIKFFNREPHTFGKIQKFIKEGFEEMGFQKD